MRNVVFFWPNPLLLFSKWKMTFIILSLLTEKGSFLCIMLPSPWILPLLVYNCLIQMAKTVTNINPHLTLLQKYLRQFIQNKCGLLQEGCKKGSTRRLQKKQKQTKKKNSTPPSHGLNKLRNKAEFNKGSNLNITFITDKSQTGWWNITSVSQGGLLIWMKLQHQTAFSSRS